MSELLRFTTAGSVDDGKSTLIGRLLYDSKTVYEDQLAGIRKATRNQAHGTLDLSLLTDGLRAEREQGITIDVAYRYFSTPRRKFIIADTPGHEQYTRNMATGASTAHLAIVLIDARHGVLAQSRRHAFIATLLGIGHLVVAVNKMDLVEYREEVFRSICADFSEFAAQIGSPPGMQFIPLSALCGDNVVERSTRMPWYQGPALLEYLETVPIAEDRYQAGLRLPVQYVIRPTQDFRGLAGQLASGVVRRGDAVTVLPSGRQTRVRSIVTREGELEEAFAPMSVTVRLEQELDVSRGDMLVSAGDPPQSARRFAASLVWMNEKPAVPDRPYLLKHTTQTLPARIVEIRHRVDIHTLAALAAEQLQLNEIGAVVVEAQRPIFLDPYRRNRYTGSFILIDPLSNETVGAGMIEAAVEEAGASVPLSARITIEGGYAGRAAGGSRDKPEGGSAGEAEGGSQHKPDGGSEGDARGEAEGGSPGKPGGGSAGEAEGGSPGKPGGGSAGNARGNPEGFPEVLWALARMLVEKGHPVGLLPGQVLLVGPAGGSAVPSAASVEIRFSAGELAGNLSAAADRILRELVRRGITA
jgi:sulfate adenylyltransferase large subunit